MKLTMKFFTAALLGGTLLSFTLPPGALAQEGGLDEIVVTAQKREENLQQTPLAISAISEEKLDLLGVSEVTDLTALAPNLSVNPGVTNATAAVISIRGIPNPADETQGFDTPIGLYIDGVYQARSSVSANEVAEIERVEVLRGPQGTLWGRNTTGGAINFITKRPTEEKGVDLRLGYGDYQEMLGKITLNSGEILNGLRLSGAYMYKKREGVVDNLLEPDDDRDPGAQEVNSARVAAVIDRGGPLTITNIFDYAEIEGVPHANQLAQVGDGVSRPNVTIDGIAYAQVQPANVAGYLAAATPLEPGCGEPVTPARLDTICLENAGESTDKLWGNLFRVELDLDGVNIRSTTAYRSWENLIRGSDLDGLGTISGPLFSNTTLFNGMPASTLAFLVPSVFPTVDAANFVASQSVPTTTQPLFQAFNDREQSQWSQEIEIVSDGGGNFDWVLGAFFFDESGSETNPQSIGFVLNTNQAVFSGFGGLSSLLQAGNPAPFRLVAQAPTLAYDAEGRSFAVYGQGTYRPGGADGPLGLTLGLRYTWDRKEVDRSQNGATPFDEANRVLNQQTARFSEPTGHITVDYRASDDINVYARAARGYRSGGFNLRQSTSLANNIPLIPFSEEVIDSFEVGMKTEFFDRLRLNGAVFYNNYKDLQATIPIPITGGGSFGTQVVNAGEIDYFGVELEAQFALNENISFDGAFGYVDKDVKQFPSVDAQGLTRGIDGTCPTPSPTIVPAPPADYCHGSGIADVITPGNSPDYTANAAVNLFYPLGGEMEATGRIGWNYIAKQYYFPNPLTSPFNDAIKQKGYGRVDAQLRISGIQAGVGDGLAVTIWGRNLGDKDAIARGIDFGQLGFGSVIYSDPRTFGVTVDFAF
ncbi:MAG: TonB-dependent receptor [Acidobacteria bacterium]|nr:TonB-dependent receptor [Acidobacteriota bacterium]